jgi:hypothetical protein
VGLATAGRSRGVAGDHVSRYGRKSNAVPLRRLQLKERLDERKSAGSGITTRTIRRSDRYRGWLRSDFVATEGQEADHRPHYAKHLGNVGLVSNDLTLETSCTDFLVYASAGMITV